MALSLVLLTYSVLPRPAVAQTGPTALQPQAGYYRAKIGAVNLTALCDGTVPIPLHELLTNTTPAEVDQLLANARMANPVEGSVNAYLLELGSRLVLVDAGAGTPLPRTLPALRTLISPDYLLYSSDYYFAPKLLVRRVAQQLDDALTAPGEWQVVMVENTQPLFPRLAALVGQPVPCRPRACLG